MALATLAIAWAPPVAADHEYVEPVWFTWDAAEMDILVAGVADPLVGNAIREAIEAWQVGIPQFAPTWLSDALKIRAYFPGFDVVPPAGFQPSDIEVYVAPVGFMALQTGFTIPAQGKHCQAFAPAGYLAPNPIAPEELYFTAAQEIAHCLGLGHVFNHGQEYQPAFDLMGQGSVYSSYGKSCPSNINVLVLERVYGGLFGRPSGGSVTLPSSAYEQSDC